MIKNKLYIKLIAVYFIYSLSVLFSKIAGVQDNNISFIVFYSVKVTFVIFTFGRKGLTLYSQIIEK